MKLLPMISTKAKPDDDGRDTSSSLETVEEALRGMDEELQAEKEVNNEKDTHDVSTSPSISSTAGDHPYRFIPLRMGGNGRTHKPTAESTELIDEIGGLTTLFNMTKFFYKQAFKDATLDKFIRDHDDPHAMRFAKWIHQKLTDSTVWDNDRVSRSQSPVTVAQGHTTIVQDRSSAHAAAWYSPKRPANEVGRHFKLDECRVWMRLHFWAMRETLGDTNPSFTDYYVRFIGHFVNVYEGSAPAFARESYRWSRSAVNIQKYIDNGRRMNDVLGLSLGQSLSQLPEDEANDEIWPYIS